MSQATDQPEAKREVPPEAKPAPHPRVYNRSIESAPPRDEKHLFIGSPTKWAPPPSAGGMGPNEYRLYLETRSDLLAAIPELIGRHLICYSSSPCWADVLIEKAAQAAAGGALARDPYLTLMVTPPELHGHLAAPRRATSVIAPERTAMDAAASWPPPEGTRPPDARPVAALTPTAWPKLKNVVINDLRRYTADGSLLLAALNLESMNAVATPFGTIRPTAHFVELMQGLIVLADRAIDAMVLVEEQRGYVKPPGPRLRALQRAICPDASDRAA